ncbi:MAG: hypothetical protein OK449_07670 [Thaumarchaeota archaeon]|nr:hypothetical protein [Nitrososphaerota archaeon]
MLSDVQMKRDATTGSFPFLDVFMGFEALEAVRSMFGDKTEKVLTDLRVDIQARPGYLRVDDETGNIVVSGEYLRTGDERYLYLDVVHELVHVRQFIEGKELFDRRYSYVDRPTEIEAYQACVAEGRKIGMENDEVLEYLRVEWITEEEFGRLLASVGVKPKKTPERPKKSGA